MALKLESSLKARKESFCGCHRVTQLLGKCGPATNFSEGRTTRRRERAPEINRNLIQFRNKTFSLYPNSSFARVKERYYLPSLDDATKVRYLFTVSIGGESLSQVCSELPGPGRAQVSGAVIQEPEEG